MNKATKIGLIIGASMISVVLGLVVYRKFFKKGKGVADALNDVYKTLLFEFGKATIKPSSFVALDELAESLINSPEKGLEIIGHTDNVGSASVNLKLSQDRANAVKKYLLSKGIEESRLVATGKGMTEPIADNNTAEGREKNRRVEFIIFLINV
jgi:OOP family OmpA-OmpF porin